jgi:hypothetical protein
MGDRDRGVLANPQLGPVVLDLPAEGDPNALVSQTTASDTDG